jgi:hypothetical protein
MRPVRVMKAYTKPTMPMQMRNADADADVDAKIRTSVRLSVEER